MGDKDLSSRSGEGYYEHDNIKISITFRQMSLRMEWFVTQTGTSTAILPSKSPAGRRPNHSDLPATNLPREGCTS